MATVNPASSQPKATTAEDTLQRKSRDASVISGGHLVAKALKNEGVDTIFTLCGGHIIDIYDGCVDEGIRIIDVRHEQVAAHAADGYARQTGKLGCVVTTAGPGFTNALTGIATAFRSESPVLHIGGQGALTQHKMGSLQDLPHVDVISPITKFAATVPSTERVADMVSMAAREAFNGAPGPVYLEIPRDVLDREVDIDQGRHSAAGQIPCLDAFDRRPGRHREAGRYSGQRGTAGDSVRAAGVDRARPQGSDRAAARPGYPRILQRREPRPAAARRSASFRPHAHSGVCERRCAGDRRHAVRLPHGLRQTHQQGLEAGADRHGLPHRRQEPRHQLRAGRRSRRDPGRGAAGGVGADQGRQAAGAPAVAEATQRRGDRGRRQADALVQVEQRADSSLSRRLGTQRIPGRGHDLHRRRRRRGDHLGASGAAARPRPVDGSGSAGVARASAPDSRLRRDSPILPKKFSATTATVRSA